MPLVVAKQGSTVIKDHTVIQYVENQRLRSPNFLGGKQSLNYSDKSHPCVPATTPGLQGQLHLVTIKTAETSRTQSANTSFPSKGVAKLSDSGVRRHIESALLGIRDVDNFTSEQGPHQIHTMLRSLVPPSGHQPDKLELLYFQEIPSKHLKFIENNLQKYIESLNVSSMISIGEAKTRVSCGKPYRICSQPPCFLDKNGRNGQTGPLCNFSI